MLSIALIDIKSLGEVDPPPAQIEPPLKNFFSLKIVGSLNSYWYNNFIYESNIARGTTSTGSVMA